MNDVAIALLQLAPVVAGYVCLGVVALRFMRDVEHANELEDAVFERIDSFDDFRPAPADVKSLEDLLPRMRTRR